MPRPDLDAIRKRLEKYYRRNAQHDDLTRPWTAVCRDLDALLTYVEELETEMQGLYKDIQWSRA